MLFAETGIKVFSNFFGIDFESFVNACRNIDNIGIFFEREREVGQFAKKEIRFIGGSIFESYEVAFFYCFNRNHPKLMVGMLLDKNENIIMKVLTKLQVEFFSDTLLREFVGEANKSFEALFVGNWNNIKIELVDIDGIDFIGFGNVIPAQFIEKTDKVVFLDIIVEIDTIHRQETDLNIT